jgi:imidazole glycerol-phosphate synthase subunit HisF
MLKTRIIPTLLMKDVGLVKGVRFDSWRYVGTVLPAIKVYVTRDVDELILVDISATREDRRPDISGIRDVASECSVPLTAGGGVRSVDDVRELLRAGADKVCVNSAAYESPEVIRDSVRAFGTQCVVGSIDFRRRPDGTCECYSHSGTKPTSRNPIVWARELEQLGVGEILVTSIDRDGTMEGYDLPLLKEVAASVSIPVIASGGAGIYLHFYEAIVDGGASAVAAASMFHFTQQTPLGAKDFLGKRGVPVRYRRT